MLRGLGELITVPTDETRAAIKAVLTPATGLSWH
jgi:hypothetical protein